MAPWEVMVVGFVVIEKKKNLISFNKETTTFSLSRVSVCIRLACPPSFLTVSGAPSYILAFFRLTLWGAL